VHRVVIVGPTSARWAEIAESVEDDVGHLRRPGLEVVYVTTGAGPRSIRSHEDEVAAVPHVVDAVRRVAVSCDAVVVDCTGDPGVAEARLIVDIPVVGAGEAARRAAEGAPEPVRFVSGEELRAVDFAELERLVDGAATVSHWKQPSTGVPSCSPAPNDAASMRCHAASQSRRDMWL
jgi:hypothetical protein